MQKPVVDVHLASIRSDLESFKGIRERASSDSFYSDGYESDNTLDNVSEIPDSESEIESSVEKSEVSSEAVSCSSEYVATSSSHLLTDSMTFRERWIDENGVQVTVTIRDRELETHLTSV